MKDRTGEVRLSDWFKKNEAIFNISIVEKEAEIGSSSLAKWVKGERPLSYRVEKKLEEWMKLTFFSLPPTNRP